jgi:hypothetical protein
LKTKTATAEGAIAAETPDPLAGISSEQFLAMRKRWKEEEQLAEYDADLEKRGLALSAGTFEVLIEGMDLNRIYTGGNVLGEKLHLPKRSWIGAFVEIPKGGWIPRNAVRRLSDDEAAGVVTLQAIARLRGIQALVAPAEAELRQLDSEIVNAEGVVKVTLERVQTLNEEKPRAVERLEAAKLAVENFFEGRPAEWRERALEAMAEDWNRTPKLEAPLPARPIFAPPGPNDPKTFRWNPETMTHELLK